MTKREVITMKEQVAVTQNEVKHIKKTLDEICPKIQEMHETFLRGEGKIAANKTKIDSLIIDINGNGKPGLKQELQNMKVQIAYYVGGATVVLSLITFIINFYM